MYSISVFITYLLITKVFFISIDYNLSCNSTNHFVSFSFFMAQRLCLGQGQVDNSKQIPLLSENVLYQLTSTIKHIHVLSSIYLATFKQTQQ